MKHRWPLLAVLAAALATAMSLLAPRTLLIETGAEEPAKPPASDEFPFSPRPNRAREIRWRAWSPAVFEEAAKAGKPVAVVLTATWCQKCHEMDEGAFSDGRVIELLNARYVCVRVDTDRHPDIKDRYLSGKGWPTTAFCTSSGDVIAKVWFLTADEFLASATKVAGEWDRDREGVLERAASFAPPARGATEAAIGEVDGILKGIEATWAADGSGWAAGDYRFPSPANVMLYVWKGADSGEARWWERAAAGAELMRRLEDPVEFGYYRVAMRPDWTEPHYEKLLETNAGMLEALVAVWRATGDERWGKAAGRVVEYMQEVLALPDGGWAASQDADPDYFKLDRAGRANRVRPHVDGSFYAGPNAQAASAFFAYAAASGDDGARDRALAALERIFRDLWADAGLARGAGGARDLLRDLALAGEACLDAAQATGDARWVDRANGVAARVARLADADGGLFDRPPDPAAPGRLKQPFKKSADNGRAAGYLARLAHVTGEEKWKGIAEAALKATGGEAKQFAAWSAEYAAGVARLRRYPLHIVVVGPKAGLGGMVGAANRFWHPWKTVTVLESKGEAVKHAGLEYPPTLGAYVCVADACAPPISSPAEFAEAVKAFLERNR
jgi:hypothetical protein